MGKNILLFTTELSSWWQYRVGYHPSPFWIACNVMGYNEEKSEVTVCSLPK